MAEAERGCDGGGAAGVTEGVEIGLVSALRWLRRLRGQRITESSESGPPPSRISATQAKTISTSSS